MTGNIAQVFDTASSSYKEREPLIGALRYKLNKPSTIKTRTYKIFCRKIDAVAAFENLAATAESRQDLVSNPLQMSLGIINQFFRYRTIRLWDLTTSCSLVSWVATKTYIR